MVVGGASGEGQVGQDSPGNGSGGGGAGEGSGDPAGSGGTYGNDGGVELLHPILVVAVVVLVGFTTLVVL